MIKTLIPKSIRKRLSPILLPKSPVLWANWGIVSHCLARWIAPLSPAVLILSLPRSGSSWVGETLGLSRSSLYLREPITQTHLKLAPKASPSFFEFSTQQLPTGYAQSAQYVFEGLPLFNHGITKMPDQWAISKRHYKRVVVKEVNPFMLNWLTEQYHPKIIFLIRHPAAVAASFSRMGWDGKQFEHRLLQKTLETKIPHYQQFSDSFWASHGALQGFLLSEILSGVKASNNFHLVQYEDLCEDPVKIFKTLYQFAELPWTETIEKHILKHSQPENIDPHSFSTHRNSKYEMNKWQQEIPKEAKQQIKNAYLSFSPPYYQHDW